MLVSSVADANVILRYLIGDGGELAEKARDIIESGEAYAYPEILAEVVYVLSGVYGVPRAEIGLAFRRLARFMSFYDFDMLRGAFTLFELSTMDFVDCLLVARSIVSKESVVSFDKQVMQHVSLAL